LALNSLALYRRGVLELLGVDVPLPAGEDKYSLLGEGIEWVNGAEKNSLIKLRKWFFFYIRESAQIAGNYLFMVDGCRL
jgi:hypothetical protein